MREMKDSGIEWVGKIPKEWKITKLQYLGDYINGYAFKPEQWGDFGKPIIRIQDLTGSSENPNYFSGKIDKKYLIKKGDILISWAATLDAYVWDREDSWLNQHIFKVEINKEYITKRYFYWLSKVIMENMNNDNKHGIMMQHITKNVFDKYPAIVPNFDEQNKISHYLDNKCAEIDSLSIDIQQQISQLEEYKKSVITEAVTKGLNPDVEMKDSGIGYIGDIPWNFKVSKIKQICKKITDGTHGTFNRVTEGRFFLSAKNVFNDGIHIDESKESCISEYDYQLIVSNGFPKKNDVLMCCVGTVGRATVYQFDEIYAFQRSVIFMRPNCKILSKMLMYCLQSETTIYQENLKINKTAQDGIYQNSVKELIISFPEKIQDQENIIDYLDDKCKEVESIIESKQQQLSKLEEYKKSVIYEYVTGKKEVV